MADSTDPDDDLAPDGDLDDPAGGRATAGGQREFSYLHPWDGEGPMPCFWPPLMYEDVPQLSAIARGRWRDVLLPLPKRLRWAALKDTGLWAIDGVGPATQIVLELGDIDPSAAARAALRARSLPAAEPPAPRQQPFRRANRQVNFRLTDTEYADLVTAAEIVGSTPSALARMLVVTGCRKAIAEYGGEYMKAHQRRSVDER